MFKAINAKLNFNPFELDNASNVLQLFVLQHLSHTM